VLERIRLVMLLRNSAALAEELVAQLSEEDQAAVREQASAASTLNSRTLLRLLEAAEQMRFATLPQLPFEIALVELTTTS